MKIKYILFIALLVAMLNGVLAQGPPPPPPQPGLPIDGGIWILFISGLIYGVFKIKKK